MKQFQALIFDLDGLLIDTERVALAAFTDTCTQFGLQEDHSEIFVRCIGANETRGREILRQGLSGKVDYQQFEEHWTRRCIERMAAEPVAVKAGAHELLERLSLLCIPAAVATSSRTARARQKLTDTGLLHHFAAVIGGDQVTHSKPAPDIYLHAAAALAVPPARCLALEDSENGVRAAVRAGMTVVQIPDLVAPSAALRALGHIVLRSLGEVADYPFNSRNTGV
jgi:HAD superfamily hydrolase (TIGR01509 family)